MILHLDFETRSDIDLRLSGLHNYARGRNTDVICAAYAFDDEPVELWLPGQIIPKRFFDHVESGGEVWAHNASFEQEIANNVCVRKYGWPYFYSEQMVCTMAMAYAMSLPGHLGSTAAALGIPEQKDMAGSRIMLQYCQPRDVDRMTGQIIWWDDPEKLARIYEYCKQDVVVEREIGKRMLRLSQYEKCVWELDQKINARGIAVDVPAIFQAQIIVEKEKKRITDEIQSVSGNQIATASSVQQIKDYLKLRGVVFNEEKLAKQDVVDLLSKADLPQDCRRILELRQEAGKTSTAKLEPMLAGASKGAHGEDRVRGTFQYSGANTRRWAGRRIQLQNLPRPKLDYQVVDEILDGLHSQRIDRDTIDAIYGRPLDVLKDCIRGFLIAAPGHDLLACDFSAIEARVIAFLAGQESILEIFRTHGKIYEAAAADIFGGTIENVTPDQRQIGKVAILALGYGGGVGAFQQMAKVYGVKMAPAYNALWLRAQPEQREWAEKLFYQYEKSTDEEDRISRFEFIACELTKVFWRAKNLEIVNYWHELEEAAIAAVNAPLRVFSAGADKRKVQYKMKGSFLWCKLPSGGTMCYPYPQVEEIKTPWGAKKMGLTYMSEDSQTKKWQRFKTYGGSLAENCTQSVARDILADAMLRLESKGYPVTLHAHDEIVCERLEQEGSVSEMSEIMCQILPWMEGLPLKASGFRAKRYRK